MTGRWGAALALLLAACTAAAADGDGNGIKAGINYKELTTPQATAAPPGKVEVIEFVWYDCETCYVMQPLLDRWRASRRDQIAYLRVPAVTGDNMTYFARVFYAADALGVLEQAHPALFAAIHRYGRPLDTDDRLAAFFGELGVERARFLSAFRSSATADKVRDAKLMNRRYDVQGAPTLVVNGRYRIDPTMVASPQAMIDEADFLVDRELKNRKSK